MMILLALLLATAVVSLGVLVRDVRSDGLGHREPPRSTYQEPRWPAEPR